MKQKIEKIALDSRSTTIGQYRKAPPVQRILPPTRPTYRGKPVRDWKEIDVRGVKNGEWLQVFGSIHQLRELYVRKSFGAPGRPRVNPALLAKLIFVGVILKQSYRALEGFGKQLAILAGVDPLLAPDHTTINKYMSGIEYVNLMNQLTAVLTFTGADSVFLAVDSTGGSITRSGGWRVDKPGVKDTRKGKYDKWHVMIDITTRQVVAHQATSSRTHDTTVLPGLVKQYVGKQKTSPTTGEVLVPGFVLAADGAYTSNNCFNTVDRYGGQLVAPLPRNAVYSRTRGRPGDPIVSTVRDVMLTQQNRLGSRRWKQASGYHQRSVVEAVFAAWEKYWGNRVKGRSLTTREKEFGLMVGWWNTVVKG